jgi:hypothetical protein
LPLSVGSLQWTPANLARPEHRTVNFDEGIAMNTRHQLALALLALATSGVARAQVGSTATLARFNAPSGPQRTIKADTGGRGTFQARESRPITRAYFETVGEPSVAFSDEREFKIRFRCEITKNRNDREFSLRIIDSDRGPASGTVFVRLNPDRNEVEVVNLKGRFRGNNMSGAFARN